MAQGYTLAKTHNLGLVGMAGRWQILCCVLGAAPALKQGKDGYTAQTGCYVRITLLISGVGFGHLE